jgi:hypothetical protein
MSRRMAAHSVSGVETVTDHVSAARLFVSEALTLDPRMSNEKLMAAQAEATLAVATALDGIAAAIRESKGP